MNNLEVVIDDFFHEYADLSGLHNAAIVLCRRDGVALFSHKTFDSTWNDSTASALISGMWQAAQTLTQFIPELNNEVFRFSFDTSTRGIFIIELEGDFEPLYLSFIYYNLDNPAKMKARIKSLQAKLSLFIDEHLKDTPINKANKRDVFLFSDISDDEMDNLFSAVGV